MTREQLLQLPVGLRRKLITLPLGSTCDYFTDDEHEVLTEMLGNKWPAIVGIIISLSCSLHAQTSALGTLANSMQPGQWTELPTAGMVAAFTGTGGSTGSINPYGMSLVRDPVGKAIYYLGSDHGGNYTPASGPLSTYRFVKYSDATNAWTIMPNPPHVLIDQNGYSDAHGYHLTALDPVRRELYRMAYSAKTPHVFNLDTQAWTMLPELPEGNYTMKGLTFFPERNALLVMSDSGTIYEMVRPGTTWSVITPAPSTGLVSTWQWVECHPVLHECLFGSSTGKLWKYTAAGVFTQLNDIPATYRTYDGSGLNGQWLPDPASSVYLIMTDPTNGTGRNMYQYDSATQTYTAATPVPNKHLSNSTNWTATAVPDLGVTFWARTTGGGGGSANVYVYKHGAAAPPEPMNQPPSVNVGPDLTLTFPAQANLSATVTDDGLPSGGVHNRQWSGSAGVVFSAPTSLQTMATFPAAGTYNVAMSESDGALTGTDSAVVTVSAAVPPGGSMTFAQKCAMAGVLHCKAFDQQTELKYNYSLNSQPCLADPFIQPRYNLSAARGPEEGNTSATEQNGVCVYPLVDITKPHSGMGSLKMTIPSNSGANTSGNFTEVFKRNTDGTFYHTRAGETVWFQFWQYIDPLFLTVKYNPGGGWKQAIQYGNPPRGSNSSGIEVTWVNGYLRNLPVMYGQQGADDYGIQDVRDCKYPGPYVAPPCKPYPTGWVEFTTAITHGTIHCYGGNPTRGNTRVQAWVNAEPVVDNPAACMNLTGTDGDGFGAYVLTPFQTNKDPSQSTPIVSLWYDDVIVSTQPIPMTPASDVPPPIPNNPPTVTIKKPINGEVISVRSYTIEVAATDDVGVAWLELSINGQVVKSGMFASMTYSWNTAPYKGKTVTISATSKDAENLTATMTVQPTVTK